VNLRLILEFREQLLGFHHERFNNILARNFPHRHAVLENHSDTTTKRDPELRVVSFSRPIHRTTHDRKMQRLFNVSKPALDLLDDTNEVIHVEPATSRTRNDRHAARPQSK